MIDGFRVYFNSFTTTINQFVLNTSYPTSVLSIAPYSTHNSNWHTELLSNLFRNTTVQNRWICLGQQL